MTETPIPTSGNIALLYLAGTVPLLMGWTA